MNLYKNIDQLVNLIDTSSKKYIEASRAARAPNIIFVWIPKCAGTSVFNMLSKCQMTKLKRPREIKLYFKNSGSVTFGHISVPQLLSLGLVDQSFVEKSFVFAISRNPYDRACSLYNYFCKVDLFSNWRKKPSFDQFLEILQSGFYVKPGLYNSRGLSQANPQFEWIRNLKVDRIYRFENLNQLINDLSQIFDTNLTLGVSNQSLGIERFRLTPGQTASINDIYKEDFVRFGYSMSPD